MRSGSASRRISAAMRPGSTRPSIPRHHWMFQLNICMVGFIHDSDVRAGNQGVLAWLLPAPGNKRGRARRGRQEDRGGPGALGRSDDVGPARRTFGEEEVAPRTALLTYAALRHSSIRSFG